MSLYADDHTDQELTRIYRENYKNVYYLVLSYVKERENALDLTQDIFLKAFVRINSFKGESAVSTWLYAIAKNHCLEFIRKNRKIFIDLDEFSNQSAEEEFDLEEELTRESKSEWIEKSLDAIDDPDRIILFLKYRMKLSVSEIQEQLNLSESAVKMRLQRARKRIASAWHSNCITA
jgi:RNA polymerase sigma factor (sigma-70 family)